MVKDKNEIQDTKQKILNAAEEIFFQKGFDGSRVDEIAKKAKVNKASIYYYFESKDKILEAILEKNKNEILERKKNIFTNIDLSNKDLSDKDILKVAEDFLKNDDLIKFIFDKNKFFSILLTETLKDSSNNMLFFKLIKDIYKKSLPVSEIYSNYEDKEQDLLIKIFFFISMPGIIFMTIGKKWADFNEIDKNKLETVFFKTIKEVYFACISNELVKKED